MVLIGYSGHGYVAADILQINGRSATHYCDVSEKKINPFDLIYLGKETEEASIRMIKKDDFFIGIGDNITRQKIQQYFTFEQVQPINAIHPSAIISLSASVGGSGVMIAPGVIINALAKIANGVICNTSCIIEHECEIGEFTHIAPGAILCGNVSVGTQSFIGAGSVVRQGIRIGSNVFIGAGSVVVKDVPNNSIIFGNPAKII